MFFGKNLQYLRKSNQNMTQECLAERMNVSRQTISRWESGEVLPEVSKLLELSEIFSCTLDSLLQDWENLDLQQKKETLSILDGREKTKSLSRHLW